MLNQIIYSPCEHYWTVADKGIFSSSAQKYIEESDAGYQAFVEAGGVTTPMASASDMAVQNITILEQQQQQLLTPRAMRELLVSISVFMQQQNIPIPPVITKLIELGDSIKTERSKI